MSHVPAGSSAVCTFLSVKGAEASIAFAKAVFGATDLGEPLHRDDGTLWHAELVIEGHTLMFAEAPGEEQHRPGFVYVWVPDADATFARALEHGGKPVAAMADRFYGARDGGVEDPSGTWWWIGTEQHVLTPDELAALALEEERQSDA